MPVERALSEPILDHLLATLDVAVEAFAVCEVSKGLRLVGGASAAIEVHYVLSGTMHLMVPDQPPIICGPGSVVLIPPGLSQTMAADDQPGRDVSAAENCSLTREGLMVFDAAAGGTGDLRVVCGLIMASISGSFGLLDAVARPIVEDLGDLAIVRQSYALMLDEISAPTLGSRALIGALMKACVVMLLRRHFAHSGHGPGVLSSLRDPRLGKAVTAVLDKPAAPHSVASLASVAGMSRSAFAREFSSRLAMSPMAFVARTRLHHGAELLKSTKLPVKVIAGSIGFASRSHFSRAFASAYGADPSRFRHELAASSSGAK
jgi:AraC-like DNA-binding protein